MFDRLKKALGSGSVRVVPDDSVAHWAHERMLSHMPLLGGSFAMGGRLLDRPFRAECIASSRSYITGLELLAKADLELSEEVNVIIMNRSLKRAFEAQANALYADVTGSLKTSKKALPEEVRWLSLYRDAGWNGPDDDFWARYAVLTDMPDVARDWLDAQSVEWFMDGPPRWSAEVPLILMLTRGKTYLRLQVGEPGDSAATLHALDIFEHLSSRAIQLLDR